jgi:hypothetical protein
VLHPRDILGTYIQLGLLNGENQCWIVQHVVHMWFVSCFSCAVRLTRTIHVLRLAVWRTHLPVVGPVHQSALPALPHCFWGSICETRNIQPRSCSRVPSFCRERKTVVFSTGVVWRNMKRDTVVGVVVSLAGGCCRCRGLLAGLPEL